MDTAIHCSVMDQEMHHDNLCLLASLQMFSLQKAVACCMFAAKKKKKKKIKKIPQNYEISK